MSIEWKSDVSGQITNAYGFTYKLEYEDGFIYYGKKNLYSERKVKKGKKEIALQQDKRASKFKIVRKESDWVRYTSSSDVVKKHVLLSKTILDIAYSKRELTYLETKLLFNSNALEDEKCLNENILGRFFKGNIT